MTFSRLITRNRLGPMVLALAIVAGSILSLVFIGRFDPGSTVAHAQSKPPKDEFERRLRAYLLDNPEVIAEALQRLEQQRQAASARAAKDTIKARADEIFRDPASPVGGNPEGDVTMVEFFDYNCPYCRKVVPSMAKAEADDPQLRIVYKELPILGANSTFAAKAALAAHQQGQYLKLHKSLMEAKGPLTKQRVLEIAGRIGLDVAWLEADMVAPAIQAAIDRNLELAHALRINGTPGFVIGTDIIAGAMELSDMERLIRNARTKK